jgi:alpha-galactosidase
MTKITFIGAGSLGFTSELVRDVLTFPLLEDATLSLMDINAERLEWAKKGVEKLITAGDRPAKVEATLDRAEALKGADIVLTTILAGSTEVWRHDIEIPKKYGVDINVGDTRGPSGIFRFLRTINPMMDIVRDMEKHCPNAVLLNYTNPMAMLCAALQRQTFIPVTGLCHSVQGTAMMLAEWIGAPYDEIDYLCAGINHQAWYLEYKWNGVDAYPLIHKAITERPEIYNHEQVRNEMYLAIGKYVTESSGHNSEYNPWFRKRPDLIEKYCTHGTPESTRTFSRNINTGKPRGKTKSNNGLLNLSRPKTCNANMSTPRTSSMLSGAARCSSSMATFVTRISSPICRKARVSKCQSSWTRQVSIPFTLARSLLNVRC